jgi:hypothetical protein
VAAELRGPRTQGRGGAPWKHYSSEFIFVEIVEIAVRDLQIPWIAMDCVEDCGGGDPTVAYHHCPPEGFVIPVMPHHTLEGICVSWRFARGSANGGLTH